MKKLLLFAILFASYQSFAQKGFYVKPTLGFGYSNTDPNNYMSSNKGGFAYTAGAQVGYKINHIRVESGVNYITATGQHNGYVFPEDLIFEDAGDVLYAKGYSNFKQREHYLNVPLKLGYEAAISKKLSLVPMIGAEVAFDLGSSYKGERFDLDNNKIADFKGAFDSYKPSITGTVGVHVEYRINPNLHIFCGPTGRYFLNNTFNYFNSRTVSVMPHILTMDMGVLCRF
jgi:hypothetical protein